MFVEIAGVKIAYEIYGGESAKQPLLLLHGWGCDHKIFKCIINVLQTHFTIYALDFPGFGESAYPPETYGVSDYTELTKEFIETMGIQGCHIICHSFGGRVSIVLCAKYPALVSKVVFTDAAGIRKKRTLKYYIKVYSYKLLKKLGVSRKNAGSPDYRALPDCMKKVFVSIVNEDLTHYLPKIKSPSLLIYGENDTDTPVAFGRTMERLIPDAGLVVVKNAGHYAFLDDFPTYMAVVKSFLGVGV